MYPDSSKDLARDVPLRRLVDIQLLAGNQNDCGYEHLKHLIRNLLMNSFFSQKDCQGRH